jgi:hypothetical protein
MSVGCEVFENDGIDEEDGEPQLEEDGEPQLEEDGEPQLE